MSFLTSLQSKQMFHICKLWISEAWGLTVTKRFADSPVHQSFMMQNGWGEIHIRQSPEEATRLSCYVWFWNNLIYSSLNSSHSNAWLSRAISRIPRVWPAAMSRSMNLNLQHLLTRYVISRGFTITDEYPEYERGLFNDEWTWFIWASEEESDFSSETPLRPLWVCLIAM